MFHSAMPMSAPIDAAAADDADFAFSRYRRLHAEEAYFSAMTYRLV